MYICTYEYNIFIICLTGAPKGFCDGKVDGKYAAPDSNIKFFHCTHHRATSCQSCPGGLVFKESCQSCLREGEGKKNIYILLFLSWDDDLISLVYQHLRCLQINVS